MAKPKKSTDESVDSVETSVSGSTAALFTYVGAGEDSPRVINFMGKQKFVRGQATEVTDPSVLGKILNHPCFVKGEVSIEQIHEIDEEAAKVAESARARGKQVAAIAKRAVSKWAGNE